MDGTGTGTGTVQLLVAARHRSASGIFFVPSRVFWTDTDQAAKTAAKTYCMNWGDFSLWATYLLYVFSLFLQEVISRRRNSQTVLALSSSS